MDKHHNWPTQQQIDEFNARLAAVAHHQRQACALQLADRIQQELAGDTPSQPHKLPLLFHRVRRWLQMRLKPEALPAWNVPQDLPDTDQVVIVDTTYTVIDPDGNHEEKKRWEN